MNDAEQMIDSEQIENLKQLFGDELKTFIETFFNDFEKKSKELETALQENQIETVAKIAHALKGSSLNMGATPLGKACFAVETAGKNKDLQSATKEYTTVQSLYPITKAAFLKAIL